MPAQKNKKVPWAYDFSKVESVEAHATIKSSKLGDSSMSMSSAMVDDADVEASAFAPSLSSRSAQSKRSAKPSFYAPVQDSDSDNDLLEVNLDEVIRPKI
mmetsp:Transcript_35627/g.46886  ORF Transcript_35627/g.46886 Transcript_35627/m.46886 type:complete len:100 (-) Transcript_35627:57-356(-)